MRGGARPRKRFRVRVFAQQTEGAWKWYAALMDSDGTEVSRSPEGTEHEAEGYMENHRRYGAWLKS